MKKIYQRLQQFLGFSQKETNGFLLLSALMLLAIAAMFWIPALFPAPVYDPTADRKLLDSLVTLLDTTNPGRSFTETPKSGATYTASSPQQLFPFDPNHISAEQWQQLGLPRFLAERILRYRSKGGSFRVKSDLKKIYDFPESLYAQLHPYIQLPDNPISYRQNSIANENKNPAFDTRVGYRDKREARPGRFDLNMADTNQLKAIRGIGSGLSRRIIKYRDALGGFASPNQVYEVYGLDSAVVNELFTFAYLSENQSFKKIKINAASFEELNAHPYITPRLAKIIIAYRQQHGTYHSANDLAQIKILDPATLQKIAPYLSFE